MMRPVHKAALVAALGLTSGVVQADTLFGVYAGIGQWDQAYSGDVASGFTDIDVEQDLDVTDERNTVAYAALEHGVPVLPNLRFQYADIQGSGRNVLSRTVEFQGEVFSASDTVASELEMTQMDAVLYYELLDNVVSLDLGLAARFVDGEVSITSSTDQGRADFKGVLPMLYGRARVDLPLTGLWIGADAMGVGYDGDQLTDVSAQVGWESPLGLGAELGWRSFDLEFDDYDDIDSAELTIDGPYAAVNFHF